MMRSMPSHPPSSGCSTWRNVIRKWDTVQGWKQALNHFEMLWGDRIQAALNR